MTWLKLQLGIDRTLGAKIWTHSQTGSAPSELEAQDIDVALWLGSMKLIWSPAPASWSVRPYATGGSGFKYFSVDAAELRELGVSAGDIIIDGSVQVGAERRSRSAAAAFAWRRPITSPLTPPSTIC
ncbi:MAG: hypothetical protein ACREK5_07155 [Gemmatimonadota bacterium]